MEKFINIYVFFFLGKPNSTTTNNSSENAGQFEQTNKFYICPHNLSNKDDKNLQDKDYAVPSTSKDYAVPSTSKTDDFVFKIPEIPPKRTKLISKRDQKKMVS